MLLPKEKKKRERRLLVDHNREHQDYKHSLTRTEVLNWHGSKETKHYSV